MSIHDQLTPILNQIESYLRILGLWELTAPNQQALSSQLPFSHDTLEFHQWLQWIFIPRTRMLIRNQAELPRQSDIHSMAELYFETSNIDAPELLLVIKSFDQLLVGQQ